MVFSMFCMDKLLISSFQLEQIADGSERQHRDFMTALPNCLLSRFPGMGNIIATIWAMDNIHHFMAIIHSFPESPFRLDQIPMAVKMNVSPKTPAIWISLGGSIH